MKWRCVAEKQNCRVGHVSHRSFFLQQQRELRKEGSSIACILLPQLTAGREHIQNGVILLAEQAEERMPHIWQAKGGGQELALTRESDERVLQMEVIHCKQVNQAVI